MFTQVARNDKAGAQWKRQNAIANREWQEGPATRRTDAERLTVVTDSRRNLSPVILLSLAVHLRE